jgi:antibiotic biosynthesis monooxygenase (ABM) superfamily enzyme
MNRFRCWSAARDGAYPVITGLLMAFSSILADWPIYLRTLVVVPLMVLIMTFAVQPLMTRLFGTWLRTPDSTRH